MKDKLMKAGYLIGLLCLIASVALLSNEYTLQLRIAGGIILLITVLIEVITKKNN